MKKLLFLCFTLLLCAAPVFAQTFSFQGFEVDNSSWDVFTGLHATRVASGTNGVISKTGSFHAEAAGSGVGGTSASSAATNWGGYSFVPGCAATACAVGGVFPADGYLTSVDIYLNLSATSTNDTRFDFTSAINQPSGAHRRDFAFNGGFYNDTDGTGSGPRFVFSASNNTGRANSFPKNPGREPFAITATGWYTFQHKFYDNGSGVLAVELSIINSSGTTLKTWTLSDATDIIGTTVGGNRYGWFANNEFSFLAIDNATTIKVSTVSPHSFLANEQVTIARSKHSASKGDIHSNGGIYFQRGDPNTYYGNLTAGGAIKIDKEIKIDGDATAGGKITLSGNAKILGSKTQYGTVTAIALPSLSYSAGGSNVTVAKKKTVSIAPGSYNNVIVNDGGTLKFVAGTYNLNILETKDDENTLYFDVTNGPVILNIVSNLRLSEEVTVKIVPDGEDGSEKVTFNTMQSTQVLIGKESYVLGNIIAPNAEVYLAKNVSFRGAISAKRITVDRDVYSLHHSSPGTLPFQKGSADDDEELLSEQAIVPDYVLSQNYPNPFNPSTRITFALPEAGHVQLHIYNSFGQLVRNLANRELAQGWHELVWDGRNQNGQTVATGVYLYRIIVQDQTGAATYSETRRMSFVK